MSTQCCIPSFKVIGSLVPKKKIFYGFYYIWAWRPSWSCDTDHLNKLSFPHLMKTPYEIWLQSAQWFLRRRCLKSFDNRRQTHDGRRRPTYPISPISSPMSFRLIWAKKKKEAKTLSKHSSGIYLKLIGPLSTHVIHFPSNVSDCTSIDVMFELSAMRSRDALRPPSVWPTLRQGIHVHWHAIRSPHTHAHMHTYVRVGCFHVHVKCCPYSVIFFSCHWLVMGKNENWHLLLLFADFLQNFYRNFPWVVLYQT